MRKVTEFYVGSHNHIYKEGFWKISYSDDDNISNFNPCFLFENVGEFIHAGGFWRGNGNIGSLCIFFKSVPTATVILSHAGLLGKNSTKLPKKITYYNDSGVGDKVRDLDINYELDKNGYVMSMEAIDVKYGGSHSEYCTLWDFSYEKY